MLIIQAARNPTVGVDMAVDTAKSINMRRKEILKERRNRKTHTPHLSIRFNSHEIISKITVLPPLSLQIEIPPVLHHFFLACISWGGGGFPWSWVLGSERPEIF